VQFIHESIRTDAIVERFIDGQELYVGVLGNQRLQVFPVWEMTFANMPDGQHRIATERVKWNAKYQKKVGIDTGEAKSLSPESAEQVRHVASRAYKVLEQSGYARIDLRLDTSGRVHVLEANPNPQIARTEDFAASAAAAGLDYPALLQRILTTGLRWEPDRLG
jgi:D-alanine-D-alanine ligase